VANTAARNRLLQAALGQADLVYCDGAGVRLGARILGATIPRRMTGADFVWDLAALAADRGHSIFWLGGREGVARRAAERLVQRYPDLRIAGTHHGYFDRSGAETEAVVTTINDSQPTIVLVGLGTPTQEVWAIRHRGDILAPVVWCIGATADFVAGELPRAPRWMLDNGLEWLHRMWTEPRRMFRRYVVGNPLFVARMMRQRLLG
jgi:N-acetylglucosaminyldiphosphoundecaprenol N-acetyl-beta-D-mannosaminyltransferase